MDGAAQWGWLAAGVRSGVHARYDDKFDAAVDMPGTAALLCPIVGQDGHPVAVLQVIRPSAALPSIPGVGASLASLGACLLDWVPAFPMIALLLVPFPVPFLLLFQKNPSWKSLLMFAPQKDPAPHTHCCTHPRTQPASTHTSSQEARHGASVQVVPAFGPRVLQASSWLDVSDVSDRPSLGPAVRDAARSAAVQRGRPERGGHRGVPAVLLPGGRGAPGGPRWPNRCWPL